MNPGSILAQTSRQELDGLPFELILNLFLDGVSQIGDPGFAERHCRKQEQLETCVERFRGQVGAVVRDGTYVPEEALISLCPAWLDSLAW